MNKFYRYFITFFVSSIAFGILGILGSYYHYGFSKSFSIWLGIIAGIIFGFCMSIGMRNLAGETVDRPLRPTDKIKVALPFDQTFSRCLESLKLIEKLKVTKQKRDQGIIVARTGFNRQTWGEIIKFKLIKSNDKFIQVEISSRPRVWTTLYDYGKNFQNVRTISNFLTEKQEMARS